LLDVPLIRPILIIKSNTGAGGDGSHIGDLSGWSYVGEDVGRQEVVVGVQHFHQVMTVDAIQDVAVGERSVG